LPLRGLLLHPLLCAQGFRVEIPLARKNVRGDSQPYPIKLFYTSNIPIILQTALVSNMYFFSQLLHKRFPTNFLVNLFGRWQSMPNGQSVPVGGLAYFVSPPQRCVVLAFVRHVFLLL
jgi:protein transport protein SEC61 subunit alpha